MLKCVYFLFLSVCLTTFADVLLEAFVKLWKTTNNFFKSVCPCVSIEHIGSTTEWILMKFDIISVLFENMSRELKFLSKSYKNKGYFTWILTNICANISQNSS
jgi:hypothetical protein